MSQTVICQNCGKSTSITKHRENLKPLCNWCGCELVETLQDATVPATTPVLVLFFARTIGYGVAAGVGLSLLLGFLGVFLPTNMRSLYRPTPEPKCESLVVKFLLHQE